MAPSGNEALPELVKVFAGEVTAFSWHEAYQTLKHKKRNHVKILSYLSSSRAIKDLLLQKVPSLPPPSQQAKSAFETKTAAINVTPSAGKSYDIGRIKADATWLSSEVTLSEEESLRIVILEWELEPRQRLLSGYAEAELASLRDVVGGENGTSDVVLQQAFPRRAEETFETKQERRKRILVCYFREQAGLIGVSRELLQESVLLGESEAIVSDFSKPLVQEMDRILSTDLGLDAIFDTIDARLRTLDSGKQWSIDSVDFQDIWAAAEWQNIRLLLEILILRLRKTTDLMIGAETVLHWFRIAANCEFFAQIDASTSVSAEIVSQLQATAAIVSLAMLDSASAIANLAASGSSNPANIFYLQTETAGELTRILFTAAEACIPQAGPAALAWTLILNEVQRAAMKARDQREGQHTQRSVDQVATYDAATGRRASGGSMQQSIYEDVLDHIVSTSSLTDPIGYMLRCTVEVNHALEVAGSLSTMFQQNSSVLSAIEIQIIQELVTVAIPALGYAPEVLGAQFAILSPPLHLDHSDSLPDPCETFIKNDFLMESIFAVAAARFPYESIPFLRLCRLLAPARIYDEHGTQYIQFRLRTLDTFTQCATGAFASYHTVREDENLNLVALGIESSMVRGPAQKLISYGVTQASSNVIPTNTVGEVISESSPPVIRWQHTYSGIALLGTWVELHYLGQLESVLSPGEATEDVITEIIHIFSSLLASTLGDVGGTPSDADRRQLQDKLFSEATATLESGLDLIDCVFEIMEQELQAFRRRPSNTFNTSILEACISFITVLIQIRPDRFWALIIRSSLLESYGSDSFLLSIISAVEAPNQSYPLLQACSMLYARTIAAGLQTSRSSPVSVKSNSQQGFAPQALKMQATAVLSLTRSLYTIYDSISGWSFSSLHQMNDVVEKISGSFQQILLYANGFGGVTSTHNIVFTPSSQLLMEQMRPKIDDSLGAVSVLKLLLRAAELSFSIEHSVLVDSRHLAVQSLTALSLTLTRLSKVPSNALSSQELQMFNAMPILVRFLSAEIAAVQTIAELISELLSVVESIRPVSLLGHLGSVSSLCLIDILKALQAREGDTEIKVAAWQLLASFVGRSQQWLALVILTGSPPDKSSLGKSLSKVNPSIESRGRTLMDIAIDTLVSINTALPRVAIAMLKFVIQAQQNWAWTASALKMKQEFLPALITYIRDTFIDTSSPLRACYKNRITSLVTDLVTTHLHYARSTQDKDAIRTAMSLLFCLAESDHAVKVGSYNSSLHGNLKKNFASTFPGLSLSDFKKKQLSLAIYGEDYYYDMEFAKQVFQNDTRWQRHKGNPEQSFSAEFVRANLNLSLVDSELGLLKSCQNFFVEHCSYFVQDTAQTGTIKPTDIRASKDVYEAFTSLARSCLKANTQVYPSQQIFESVFQSRADLAIALLQRLVDVNAKGFEIKGLVSLAWDSARFRNASYEQALANDDLKYWRSTLTIIFLALQFHCGGKWSPRASSHDAAALLRQELTNVTPTVLEILSVVVGQGCKSVVGAIQDQRQQSSTSTDAAMAFTKDLALILSILKTVLRLTRVPEFISEASERLVSSGLIQSCLLLYSWSHLLTNTDYDNEPVYADICLQYLRCLSCFPTVAEEMGVEGVLSRLLSIRTTQNLQNVPDGAGHLDKRPHHQFLYSLWSTGILPICLNLLHSMGGPIAAEISVFLNQFPKQLDRASTAFIAATQSKTQQSNSITLTSAREAAMLALISFILETYRSAGASAAVDPMTIQPLTGYDEHKRALSEDINDILGSGSGGVSARVIATNEEEVALARVKENGGNRLEQKVTQELKDASMCLKGREVEDEDK